MIFLIVFRVAVRVGICILFRPHRDGNTSEYAAFLPVKGSKITGEHGSHKVT